jgi:CPA2 family monovalent cation:H+ antiporter-2
MNNQMVLRTDQQECTHGPARPATPRSQACESCGSRFNLRVCADCGFVGCCESQLGHNRVHAFGAGHPVIRSLPLRNGSFTWCYECNRYL